MNVDVERLTSIWLRTQTDLTSLIGQNIYTELPNEKSWPALRLTLVDEQAVTERPLWVTDSLVQFDCWGGTKVLARQIADQTRELLDLDLAGWHTLGVVSGVRFGSFGYTPDADFNPAKPRYRFDAHIYTHPVPTSAFS